MDLTEIVAAIAHLSQADADCIAAALYKYYPAMRASPADSQTPSEFVVIPRFEHDRLCRGALAVINEGDLRYATAVHDTEHQKETIAHLSKELDNHTRKQGEEKAKRERPKSQTETVMKEISRLKQLITDPEQVLREINAFARTTFRIKYDKYKDVDSLRSAYSRQKKSRPEWGLT